MMVQSNLSRAIEYWKEYDARFEHQLNLFGTDVYWVDGNRVSPQKFKELEKEFLESVEEKS